MTNGELKVRRATQEAERVAAGIARRTPKAAAEPKTYLWTRQGLRVQRSKRNYLRARARLARIEASA
jgi:hypothetical protein